MNDYHHCKRILIVEDDVSTVDILKHRLKRPEFELFVASNLQDAIKALEEQHFHVAIVDLSLTNSVENYDGMDVLQHIIDHYPKNTILRIVLTARTKDGPRILKITQDYRVEHYISKEIDYGPKILECVQEYFKEGYIIKFDLNYQGTEQILMAIADELATRDTELREFAKKIGEDKLTQALYQEIRDILGKFFHDADVLHIERMTSGMTASAVLKVRPILSNMQDNRYVIKFGRRDKINEELQRYTTFAARLHDNIRLHHQGAVLRRHLGGLGYRLATNTDGDQIVEFDWLYRHGKLTDINASFKYFFDNTLHHWYKHQNKAELMSLVDIYAEALNLGGSKSSNSGEQKEKINEKNFRTRLIRLYESMEDLLENQDLNGKRINILFPEDGDTREVTNPLQWIKERLSLLKVSVSLRVTHGDLTGRNLMVDQRTTLPSVDIEQDEQDRKPYHRMQLIDFYRTGMSHVLRDVVILETDLKFRLYHKDQEVPLKEFEAIERQLLTRDSSYNWSDEAIRLFDLIIGLRRLSVYFDSLWNRNDWRRQYYIALILTTLNITRFERMSKPRRRQAILSASMICDWLMENEPTLAYAAPEPQAVNSTTRRFQTRSVADVNEGRVELLSEKLKSGQALLFIGGYFSGQRDNERSLQGLASKLADELTAKMPYFRANNLSPAQIFDRYESETQRQTLLQKYREYFAGQQNIPDYFLAAAELPWSCVYTTNQHDYFEQALDQFNRPYSLITSHKGQLSKNGILALHKMCGSVNTNDAHDPAKLPLTTLDYTMHVNTNRLDSLHRHMWQQLVDTPIHNNAPIIVMLFPSPSDMEYYEHIVHDKGNVGSRVYVLDNASSVQYAGLVHVLGSPTRMLYQIVARLSPPHVPTT